MVIGSISKESPMPLLIAAKPVQQVSEYKFLGVTVNSRLKWYDHIAAITSKAAKRLWFLKKLKRAAWSLKRRPCVLLPCRLLSDLDQSWSMHARLGTRASQKIRQSRSKISSAVLSRSSSATSRTKKHVVC